MRIKQPETRATTSIAYKTHQPAFKYNALFGHYLMQRFVAEAWRELSERFLEVFRYPVERVLNITPTPDGVVVVQNVWDGRLRTWMISSIATLRWLIYEATAGENAAENLPPLNSIVLERERWSGSTYGEDMGSGSLSLIYTIGYAECIAHIMVD